MGLCHGNPGLKTPGDVYFSGVFWLWPRVKTPMVRLGVGQSGSFGLGRFRSILVILDTAQSDLFKG